MPIKVKKEKKAVKQKQKQSQKQVVNIKIGEVKKAVRRRRGGKKVEKAVVQSAVTVQPTAMYKASEQQNVPQQNIGAPQPQARPNLLGGELQLQPEEVRRVREEALQIGRGEEVRQNILGGGFLPREEIARQRVLRLDTPLRVIEPEQISLYRDFPIEDVRGIEEEVEIEPLQFEEQQFPPPPLDIPIAGSSGSVRREAGLIEAREIRRALQLSEKKGADVPIELLLQGIYNLPGQARRPQPTREQKDRLAAAGQPYKESPKKKK